MGKLYSTETKDEVLDKIRGGHRVSEVAKTHGINEMTVRSWLEHNTTPPAAKTLELSLLQRENEALLP